MPELPEVTTTVKGLQSVLPKLTIKDVWTDLAVKNQKVKQFQKTIKNDQFFKKLKKLVSGARVLNVERRAKNILINLSNDQTILIHMKMTGHLIFGKYIFHKKKNKWTPDKKEIKELHDPYNRFIHAVFSLSNKKHLAFCDARKFGKITIFPTRELTSPDNLLNKLGPEPLDITFTFEKFVERLKIKKNSKIKSVLIDQSIISGIGNIYSDEMLWSSSIHPESKPRNIPNIKLKLLYKSMRKVLITGINFGGDSTSDYRNIRGAKGNFQGKHNVYRRENKKCVKKGCNGVIIRKVIGGRSAHFCNHHQKIF